jgi:hypothetical protein
MARSLRELPRYVGPPAAGVGSLSLVRDELPAAARAVEELAKRLEGDEPVDVRGVALARVLLDDAAGIVYSRVRAEMLLNAAGEALRALTPT